MRFIPSFRGQNDIFLDCLHQQSFIMSISDGNFSLCSNVYENMAFLPSFIYIVTITETS